MEEASSGRILHLLDVELSKSKSKKQKLKR